MNQLTVRSKPWDRFDGYLFDIDGTLLHCTDAVHYFAFCDVLQHISGRELNLDGVTAHGNTDVGILRDALRLASVADSRWRPRLNEIRRRLCEFVDQRKSDVWATALPGVHAALQHLQTKGAMLGIATGNLEEIGRLKLQRAGLLQYFDVGGWSDEYEFRVDVFRAAVASMRLASNANATICVVGDTPADVLAAHANSLPVIAVATGIYTQQQLSDAGADLTIMSLAELCAAPQSYS